jgi:hypothetical protein
MTRRSILFVYLLVIPWLLGAQWAPDLGNTPNLHTTTLAVWLRLKKPVPEKVVVELETMDGGQWHAEITTGGISPVSVDIPTKAFCLVQEGKTKSPLYFASVKAVAINHDAIVDAKFTWTGNDGTVYPWETDPKPLASENGRTWWPGADHNNAGHFAWRYEPNGLLIDNVSFHCLERAWYYFKPGRETESFQFNFGIPGAAKPDVKVVAENQSLHPGMAGLQWRLGKSTDQGIYAQDDIAADWTTFRWKRKVSTQRGKQYDQELRYSAQALGIQIQTDSPTFELSFQDGKKTRGPGKIVFSNGHAAQTTSVGAGLDASQMKSNWLVLLANDGTPEIPMMLVFQHQPEKIECRADSLILHRNGGVGTLAIGAPFGVTPFGKDTPKLNSPSEMFHFLNSFANLLTAYPWKCREAFAVSNGWVHIKNKIEFLPWSDDWKTQPVPYSPLPPFVPYAVAHGYIPRDCIHDVRDLKICTKWGPYFARQGTSIDYKLPIPRAWDFFPLAVEPKAANQWLYERLAKSMTTTVLKKQFKTWPPTPTIYPHADAHDHSAGAWRAANFLSDDARERLRKLTSARVQNALFPQDYRYRRDPITGAQYVACTFTWGGPDKVNDEGFADIDFWQGLTLYGLYTQAKYAGDWDIMRKHWATIRSLLSYWEALHSWAMMGPGAREDGEIYGADMATAGYVGLVGYYRLATVLGTNYQRDLGAYLLAKNALPRLATFSFVDWCPKMHHQSLGWGHIANGFHELAAATLVGLSPSVKDMSNRDPWWGTGVIGPQSSQFEFLDLIVSTNHRDALAWETTFRGMCPNAGMKEQRPDNVMPHMIFRTFLSEELRKDALEFLHHWQPTYMLRDTHLIAAILAWECPVRLIDWTPGRITSGKWNEKSRSAKIGIESNVAPASLSVAIRAKNVTVKLDGKPVTARSGEETDRWKQFTIAVPIGIHEIIVQPTDE